MYFKNTVFNHQSAFKPVLGHRSGKVKRKDNKSWKIFFQASEEVISNKKRNTHSLTITERVKKKKKKGALYFIPGVARDGTLTFHFVSIIGPQELQLIYH